MLCSKSLLKSLLFSSSVKRLSFKKLLHLLPPWPSKTPNRLISTSLKLLPLGNLLIYHLLLLSIEKNANSILVVIPSIAFIGVHAKPSDVS